MALPKNALKTWFALLVVPVWLSMSFQYRFIVLGAATSNMAR